MDLRSLIVFVLALSLYACSPASPSEAGHDGSVSASDAGRDAGGSGAEDSGVPDGGTDGGASDSGVDDGGADAGLFEDAGMPCRSDDDCPLGVRCERLVTICPSPNPEGIYTQQGGRCRPEPCTGAQCTGAACMEHTDCNWESTCRYPGGGTCENRLICALIVTCASSCTYYLGPHDNCPVCVCERC